MFIAREGLTQAVEHSHSCYLSVIFHLAHRVEHFPVGGVERTSTRLRLTQCPSDCGFRCLKLCRRERFYELGLGSLGQRRQQRLRRLSCLLSSTQHARCIPCRPVANMRHKPNHVITPLCRSELYVVDEATDICRVEHLGGRQAEERRCLLDSATPVIGIR